jgi:hypothetical protein
MEYFLSNLEKSLTIDIPLISLAGAFVLIDSIAAIDSESGETDRKKFKEWFGKHLSNYLRWASVDDFYSFRCKILHQMYGAKSDMQFTTLLFFPADSPLKGHNNVFNCGQEKALNLDIPTFVKDTIAASRNCLIQSTNYKIHKQNVITLHPKGIAPYVNGLPVIAACKPAAEKNLAASSTIT